MKFFFYKEPNGTLTKALNLDEVTLVRYHNTQLLDVEFTSGLSTYVELEYADALFTALGRRP